ncbi:MAG: DUF1576 domain-containing protein [Rhodobacteraceae bacterium]|nr:DUF1576 domain-containing protein [Paracoccaceae bacterium]
MTEKAPKVLSSNSRLAMIASLAAAFIVYGIAVSGPEPTLDGLRAILFARDMLLTDYVELGGIGAAFVNAGLLTLIAVAVYWRTGATVGGGSIACLMLVLGFALFGKNLLNVWPILGGVYLYAKFRGEPIAGHLNTAFFGFALAPIVSEILFSTSLDVAVRIPLAIVTGLLIGFILPPIAAQLFRAHDGHNLYNMGFTAGMVGTLVVSIYVSYGFVPVPVFLWATDATVILAPFLIAVFVAMIVGGWFVDRDSSRSFREILRLSGQAPSDFVAKAGDGAVLVNMGVLGLLTIAYVLAVGSVLNGPTVAGILSVAGFGAFGKHPFNCAPIMAGVLLATLAKGADSAASGFVLAAMFSTSLAPIAGRFGWHWGLLTGAIHVSVAQSVGVLHAGLNLYNNGFAAGIVATLVSAVILSIITRGADRTSEKP